MHFPTYLLIVYFACTMVIAIRSHRKPGTSNDFLNETGNLPTWVATFSFLAANCGALEIVGLSGIAARYGVQALHFYWIGAIPALIFVSFVALPVYLRNDVRSVPEFLERRFGQSVRLLCAAIQLGGTSLTAGVSMYALAETLHVAAGWNLATGFFIVAAVAMTNALTGGLRGTMRTEILQFGLMVGGLLPMLYLSVRFSGNHVEGTTTWAHLWRHTPLVSSKAPVDMVGVIIGLGLVIGFSYWCTDFVLMQRAFTARSVNSARKVPLYAGFGKLLFSFLVVMPVVLAGRSLAVGNGSLDQTAALLMHSLYHSRFWVLAVLALVASLMTGLSANVTAFASLWTEEIYRRAIRSDSSEQHYINVGRIAGVVCILLSVTGAYATLHFESLSEFMLVIFSLTIVPFFAVVINGIFSKRGTAAGSIAGALSGVAMGGLMSVAYQAHLLNVGSELNANFYTAIVSFSVASVMCLIVSRFDGSALRSCSLEPQLLVEGAMIRVPGTLYLLAGLLLVCCLVFNLLWW